jgi:hypothetical protein
MPELPVHMPRFTVTSYGVEAWIPLVYCGDTVDKAIAILPCKEGNFYVGIPLVRSNISRDVQLYEVFHDSTCTSPRLFTARNSSTHTAWADQWGFRATLKDTVHAEWKKIHITHSFEAYSLPRPSKSSRPVLPYHVVSKLSSYGFTLPGSRSGAQSSATTVQYLPCNVGACPTGTAILTFTHSYICTTRGQPETFHIWLRIRSCSSRRFDQDSYELQIAVTFNNHPVDDLGASRVVEAALPWSDPIHTWKGQSWQWTGEDSSGRRILCISSCPVELLHSEMLPRSRPTLWAGLDINLSGSVYDPLRSSFPSSHSIRVLGPLEILWHDEDNPHIVRAVMTAMNESARRPARP